MEVFELKLKPFVELQQIRIKAREKLSSLTSCGELQVSAFVRHVLA
ncbi:hypothetical protein V6Z11_D13G089900 [Gossypium hirsutum]